MEDDPTVEAPRQRRWVRCLSYDLSIRVFRPSWVKVGSCVVVVLGQNVVGDKG